METIQSSAVRDDNRDAVEAILLAQGFERDDEGNIRAVVEIPAQGDGARIFKGKWMAERLFGGRYEAIKGRVLRHQYKALKMASVRYSWGIDQNREAVRLLAKRARPSGRPEVVAQYASMDGSVRNYMVIPDFNREELVFEVVYDRVEPAADGGFPVAPFRVIETGCVHESGISTYDGAVNAIALILNALILNRLPHATECELSFGDPQAKEFYFTLRQRAEEEKLARQAEAEARKAREQAEAEENEKAYKRISPLDPDTSFKRSQVNIVLRNGEQEKTVLCNGYTFGELFIHKGKDEDRWTVTHIQTGFGICRMPSRVNLLVDAKVFVSCFRKLAVWDFSKPQHAPRDLGRRIRAFCTAWADRDWRGVEQVILQPKSQPAV